MQIQVRPRSARTFTLRVLGLILALVLAGGLASASNLKAAKAEDSVQLTYTKWFISPTEMTGFVGGDIVGSFHGTLLSIRVTPEFYLLKAQYDIIAGDQSFSAIVQGKQNIKKGTAVLHGVVTTGWLTGEPVLAKFEVISCSQAPNGVCFQGAIRVGGATDHETSS
jgi:hypothetical protein